MSEPGTSDFDPNRPPASPAPDTKVLNPLFGTFCKTETFLATDKEGSVSHIHNEAYMDDPVAKTWTVTRVVHISKRPEMSISPDKRKTVTHVHSVKSKVSFKEALQELADFEGKCRAKPGIFTPSFPEAPSMGFAHFKAFAEREGYIFDTKRQPHARPNAEALPAGFSFYDEDIASANKHVKRPEDEFDNNGPASKAPHTHFLLDKFTRAAQSVDFNTAAASLRVVNILDRFVDQVDKAHAKLSEYCDKFQELGHGELITDAEALLKTADASVRQLKAYGVDTKEFESFVLQCQISCYVLHAEGLYGLMHSGKGDFDANEALFKSRVNQAMAAFHKIDSSEEGLKTFKDMIVQTPEPKVPATIGLFVEHYKKLRKGYDPLPAPPKPKGSAPKP